LKFKFLSGHLPLTLALIEQHTEIANILLENGNANINSTNSDGCTLFIDAIKRSDEYSAKFLLDHDCDVNLTTEDTGDTALHILCTYAKDSCSNETYKNMLNVGKNILSKSNVAINVQNKKGYTPLHLAIISGHVSIIEEILKYPDVNLNLLTKDEKHATPLLLALLSSQYIDFTIPKQIIASGADLSIIDENGDNILQYIIKLQKIDAAIFLCNHVDLNHKNNDELTALHLASKFGLSSIITKLLESGAQPNVQSGLEEMKTPLHYAIEANCIDTIQSFVNYNLNNGNDKIDFNMRDADGSTPLSLALNLKHNDLVQTLIKGGSDVNIRNGEMTLLHQAIIKESAETAIFLLEQGADINALTGDQESPLQLAIHCRLESVVDALMSRSASLSSPDILWSALESEQENIASILVKHGIDTDCWSPAPDGLLQTLLHRAIEENNEYAAVFLIRSGCDLNAYKQSPTEGDTMSMTKDSPLHMCCIHGLPKTVQTLIEFGANVNATNYENKTPLHLAIQYQHENIITILLQHPKIDLKIRDSKQGNTAFATALTVRNHKAAEKILERMPSAAEIVDSRGRNFLHLAIMREDLESVLFLLSIQVDVNSRVHDVNQTTPLMLASGSENEMLIRNLILAGARLNDRDSTQKTALHIASERGRLCAVQALLQNGCDYDAADVDGNNALHIAMRECMLPIVRELLTESRINAETMNLKGRNPLHELCRCGKDQHAASICELFIECMPNYPINQVDAVGNTPLLLAYMRGETQLCRVLVKNGACLGAENKDGVSIFNYKLATNQLLVRLLDELSFESPWSSSEFCQECTTKFTLTMRKHHW
jgi:ankyrin repeat protein